MSNLTDPASRAELHSALLTAARCNGEAMAIALSLITPDKLPTFMEQLEAREVEADQRDDLDAASYLQFLREGAEDFVNREADD